MVEIPTNSPIKRDDRPDRVFANGNIKNEAILKSVVDIHRTQQPVLLITRTAEAAEYFSQQLFKKTYLTTCLSHKMLRKKHK